MQKQKRKYEISQEERERRSQVAKEKYATSALNPANRTAPQEAFRKKAIGHAQRNNPRSPERNAKISASLRRYYQENPPTQEQVDIMNSKAAQRHRKNQEFLNDDLREVVKSIK